MKLNKLSNQTIRKTETFESLGSRYKVYSMDDFDLVVKDDKTAVIWEKEKADRPPITTI